MTRHFPSSSVNRFNRAGIELDKIRLARVDLENCRNTVKFAPKWTNNIFSFQSRIINNLLEVFPVIRADILLVTRIFTFATCKISALSALLYILTLCYSFVCVFVRCNFEGGLCSWTQLKTDVFDWKRQSGRTGSFGTGPSTDHTSKTRYGRFLKEFYTLEIIFKINILAVKVNSFFIKQQCC
jgi:hypothetical protein